MGLTYAKVRIYNPRDSSRFLELELLVDTGSTYTWVKRDRLEELGVKPMDRRRFRTIEGKVVECLGRKATCIMVFAEEKDHEVLGVTALENLSLEVDPVTKQLREAEAILALMLTQ